MRKIQLGTLLLLSLTLPLLLVPTRPHAAHTARSSGNRASAKQTTLYRTIKSFGPRKLGYGRRQGRVMRTLRWSHGSGRGRPLAGFKQVSDIHVIDEESPARVEFLDGCGSPFSAAYRVQEPASIQVGNSMLKRLARIRKGPALGMPLKFVVSTGDNIDNNQRNEQRWFIRLLDGDRVNPNSGGASYDGYTRDNFSQAWSDDDLAAAQRPVYSVGTKVPWYAVLGNHDGLVQGNAYQNPTFEAAATGSVKAFTSPEGYSDCPDAPEDGPGLQQRLTSALAGSDAKAVPADAAREFLDHKELVDSFFETSTKPKGHGLARAPQDPMHGSRGGYYSFPVGPRVTGISLDTISYDGVANGHIPDPQFQWLIGQLKRNSRHYYGEGGKRLRNPTGRDRLIVLFSHHSSVTLNQPGADPDGAPYHCWARDSQPECQDAEGLQELLHRFPNVIAWFNGHEHGNEVRPYSAAPRQGPARDFWEVNTASHIDWPQQARIIELAWKPGRRGRADSVFIYATMVDHAAKPLPNRARQSTSMYLSSLSRVESYFDACVRNGQADCMASGNRNDRNVKLVQKAPFDLGR